MAYLIYNRTDNSVLGVKYNIHNAQATLAHYGDDYDYIDAPDDFDAVNYVSVVDGVAIPEQIDPYAELRQQRNTLLKQSDWTQVPDAPVDQAAWAAYRQALRDLPANTTDPRNPTWPSKPA